MKTKYENASVRWFDNKSGEGMIRLESGENVFVHWSAIASELKTGLKKPFKNEKKVWCVLFKNQKVKVQICEDFHWKQVSKLKAA